MSDQAQNLRKVLEHKQQESPKTTKVVSIVSGKGGVGKSNLSVNAAIGLARDGYKTALIDLDIGMANVDILLGLQTPGDIVDMIENDRSIWDIMKVGPCGLHVAAGGSGLNDIFEMTTEKKERFSRQMAMLDGVFDYILFDMGAGADRDSIHFILSSHEVVVVTTPEPTSITDAYAMIKHLHLRSSELDCCILVNRSESSKEGRQTGENLQRAAGRFLQKDVELLAVIPQDKRVLQAVKKQEPFLLAFPDAPASKAMQKCLDRFTGRRRTDDNNHALSYRQCIGRLKEFLLKGGDR
ncbi:MinD/ParA family protein [Salibacterium halotolerans]|uniref:Flagellar biosynthesis protein FlhG n=1 Tax=Salibacterium halotolerans TaxID=1884432 RepID=A0A1I5MGN5_9BACI|nr:MinD/ParA family protein [Salibacterium halotolerans]SFP08106.1 flagellar biosynthesis protein FlhG [Salibacterium halotolerans]